jgi:beta-alanine--pyruvate transaminase
MEGLWQEAIHSLRQAPNVIDVRDIGLVGAVEFAPIEGRPGARGYDVFTRAFANGLLVRVTGDTVALSPPLIIEERHMDELVQKLGDAVAASSRELS